MLGMIYKVVEQLFSKKSTNFFPSKYILENTEYALKSGLLHPTVEVKDGFRGRLKYDFESCTGCGLCNKVCPANAIELYPAQVNAKKTKRIVIYLSRCTYCQECVNICPKNSIQITKDFFMAGYKKYGNSMVVGFEHRENYEIKQEESSDVQKEGN
ncbi:MAG: 4Fe-4S binding protein [Spirochaetes bacterium]|nr:4Fe-4S binding protein [Spirochaetota bacterium]